MIKIEPAALGLSGAVEPILRALPQWFGIEDATRMYIRAAGDHPTILSRCRYVRASQTGSSRRATQRVPRAGTYQLVLSLDYS